jgi:putative transposase
LLLHIRADLAASPFSGEGHRKVWARLRVQRGVRVARKRVLRLMRAHNLLSWRRCRQGVGNPHQGEIVTRAPNEMWGTDGVRVLTVEDGWVWLFSTVEHWNGDAWAGSAYGSRDTVSLGPLRQPGALLGAFVELYNGRPTDNLVSRGAKGLLV